MKDTTKRNIVKGVIALVVLLGAGVLGVNRYNSKKQEETAQLTAATERARVIENAYRSLRGVDRKVSDDELGNFYRALGQEPKVEIQGHPDGTYSVLIPSFTVTKEQLEKYANDNIRWIEE